MIFYFTATGNSLYAAKQLDETRISIAQAIHDKKMHYQAEQIGIVCPVFGHEVPELVREFLEAAVFETPYFYMILTYGNRHGGAAELAEQMLQKYGICASYINVLLMADNFLPAFDMNKQRAIDKKVEEQLETIREDIKNRRQYIAPVTDADRAAHREYLREERGCRRMHFPNCTGLRTIVSAVRSAPGCVRRTVLPWRIRGACGIRAAALPVWHAFTRVR